MTPKEAFRLFCLPPRMPLARREEEVIAKAVRVPIRHRGKQIASYLWGEGPLIVLAHGWGARAGTMTAFVDPLVEAGFSVLGQDHPGHGESEGDQCNALWVSECWDIQSEKHGTFHGAITHSFGSLGINLFHSRGCPLNKAVQLAPFNEVVKRFYEFSAALDFTEVEERAFLAYCDAWFGTGRLQNIKGELIAPLMTAEALVFHDEADQDIPASDGEALAAAWPGGVFVLTKGLGHRRIVRDKAVLARTIEFMKS